MILWGITAISLTATVMNIHRVRACFALWILTNAAWAIVDFEAGIYAQSFLHVVYLGLACYGLNRWRHEPRGAPS
ncbi:MAG: nicotinamide mononucleotide transporter [Planctomycetes bacterium]|nr:nicotinamide mononucleotide transporter [Planctomycetota bacterium]